MSATAASMSAPSAGTSGPWLFSRGVDLSVFLGSAVAAFALLGVGAATGVLDGDTPDWAWVPCVLMIDVAHVYSTSFRIYLDTDELCRRKVLYALVPALGLACALLLYGFGRQAFWTALAYLAVFHFVRQQYGWVALYRGRNGEFDRAGHWLDAAAVYAATLWPLLSWHAHLPRRFWWFLEGDFWPGVPAAVADALAPIYVTVLVVYAVRSALAWRAGRGNPGKDVVMLTTAACWFVGIVWFNSDYAFTVTNVIVHGVPYLALIVFAGRRRAEAAPGSAVGRFFGMGVMPVLATLWVLAYFEELVWDRAVWHDRPWLFGDGWEVGALEYLVVPLLALPQIVHYLLDGFIWKRRERA